MEEREPQPGDIYTYHELYVSEDFNIAGREKTLKFLGCKGKSWANGRMSCALNEAEFLVFYDEENSCHPWIHITQFPVWVNPDPKGEPGDVHYKVILYTP
jgi:hypothetical protein